MPNLDDTNLGQILNIGLKGAELQPEEAQFITENKIGGVTLFARNLQTPEQIKKLTHSLQTLGRQMGTALFIGIDMEGGRVNRLPKPFTQWPSAAQMAQGQQGGVTECMQRMGSELKSVGVNLNFAPCADVHSNPDNPIIGDRAFSPRPDAAGRWALAAAQALHSQNVFSCAKHFPGHGNTKLDSHLELPVEEVSMPQLRERELQAFAPLIKWQVPFVMTAHILYSNIENQWPATLSPLFLTQLLRRELDYKGLIITDDMGMKAIANRWALVEAAEQALRAGADVLLYCNNFQDPYQVLDGLRRAVRGDTELQARVQEKIQRVLETKSKHSTFF